MAIHPYTLEQAEEDIAQLRGMVDLMSEYISTSQIVATGTVTATGGTASVPSLITTDTWHSLGALGAHYTVTTGVYRLSADGSLELDIDVVGDGLQATSVSFANTMAAAYRPATDHTAMPMGTTRAVTAGDIWPRMSVLATGVVTVINQGTANTFGFTGNIKLN